MPLLRNIASGIRSLFQKKRASRELDEELRGFMDMAAEESMKQGRSEKDALRAVRLERGSVEAAKERVRSAGWESLLETSWRDLCYAFRMLRKSPGFTAIAILTLALGIGANVAIFTAAHAILWSTLPVANPSSLVRLVAVRQDGRESDYLPISLADELSRNSPVLSGAIARGVKEDGLSFSFRGGRAQRVMGEVVSANYFSLLGVEPMLGQGFSSGVRQGNWAAETVLSYDFWRRELGGDPHVLGQTIRLNDFPFTIVGVSPPSFYSLIVGFEPDLILPHMPQGQELSQIHLLSGSGAWIIARLKPGIGITKAQAAIETEWRSLLQENGNLEQSADPVRELRLKPGDKGLGGLGQFREPLWVLLTLSGLVLLIASTNLAGMLLARTMARSREFALRAALGAGRWRLVRQMVTESALLSITGGLIGFLVASKAEGALFAFLPQSNIQINLNLKPDMLVVLFTISIVVLTIVVLGVVPAFQTTRRDLAISLKSDSTASAGERRVIRTRSALVASHVALAVLLLVVAGLLWKTLSNLRATDMLPQPSRVLLFTIKPQVELYSAAHMRNLTTQIAERMNELPGIESAALAENGPLGSREDRAIVESQTGRTIQITMDMVTPGYFKTIGVPLLAGRDFSGLDSGAAQAEVIINQLVSRQLFGEENPLGKTISAAPTSSFGVYDIKGPLKIVGVVKAVRYYDLHRPSLAAIYLDMEQGTAYMPTLHVRLANYAVPADVVAEVRREFNSIDTNFPVFDIKTLADRVGDSMARERLVGQLASAFALVAVVLVMLGLYGVMAYTVARRSREIGIRMALGAKRIDVLRLVMMQGFKLTVAGVVAGLVGALALTRFLSSLLYGVAPADTVTFIVVSILLVLVTLVACYIPARRAMRVDPMVALRYE